jgi:succinate dehydrogenase/fumarate reductase flavoprotein subunit
LSEETWDILAGVMELSKMFEACEMAPLAIVGGKGVAAIEGCSGCGGIQFVPCVSK